MPQKVLSFCIVYTSSQSSFSSKCYYFGIQNMHHKAHSFSWKEQYQIVCTLHASTYIHAIHKCLLCCPSWKGPHNLRSHCLYQCIALNKHCVAIAILKQAQLREAIPVLAMAICRYSRLMGTQLYKRSKTDAVEEDDVEQLKDSFMTSWGNSGI